ncbi:hypothetical protein [Silvimonas iriomotensis]|uniref:Uncharacterized protein n=1 Tax=Silvimonas iriomotensis TaxID=449662 RepID=A0ABQ2P8T9_9NEIS|nr:hypothetical protein [Silvimonas iriomotensis]GGP21176.1 hypothetical protein GCM10010970_19190 [Silvimonas iriomotensis]
MLKIAGLQRPAAPDAAGHAPARVSSLSATHFLASHAPNLASTLNIGAFNVGNAMGAWLGGLTLSHGHSLDVLPWVAAAVTAGALVLTVFARKLDGVAVPDAAAPTDASGKPALGEAATRSI